MVRDAASTRLRDVLQTGRLKPIKELLPEEITYDILRFALARFRQVSSPDAFIPHDGGL